MTRLAQLGVGISLVLGAASGEGVWVYLALGHRRYLVIAGVLFALAAMLMVVSGRQLRTEYGACGNKGSSRDSARSAKITITLSALVGALGAAAFGTYLTRWGQPLFMFGAAVIVVMAACIILTVKDLRTVRTSAIADDREPPPR